MEKNTILNFKKNLTILILCGGKGLRLRPLTKDLPKPLIKVKNKSILENIISYFLKYKVDNIIVATGYKHNLINQFIKKKFNNTKVKTLFTGQNSDIIERIKKASQYSKKYLLICYGDTLIDINLNQYIKFCLKNPKKIIAASYQLESNFGIFNIKNENQVIGFNEKPLLDIWFNVGYIFFSSNFFEYFNKFKKFEYLIKYLSRKKKMKTYKHKGNHLTINTLAELEKAKKISLKFVK
jgi:glucose-1-phosphate cytidylyltransferase